MVVAMYHGLTRKVAVSLGSWRDIDMDDEEGYFVSEASVYRLLKAHDLITSPAFVVIKAADTFQGPTTAPNQLWQRWPSQLGGCGLFRICSISI